MVPVTIVAPLLHELLVRRLHASPLSAHLFMSVNMVAGMAAAPLVIRLSRLTGGPARWLVGALALDGAAFWMMGQCVTVTSLMVWRAVEGAAHLSAVTLLMVGANRLAGPRRGAVMGLMGTALTLGVGLGAPLGGLVGTLDAALAFPMGAGIAFLAALACTPLALRKEGPPPAAAALAAPAIPSLVRAVPLALGFSDRFCGGVFVSSFMLYASDSLGFPPAARGMLMMLFMVPFALSCCPAGMLTDRIGRTGPLVLGAAAFGVAFGLYGFCPGSALPWLMLVSGLLSAVKFAPTLALCGDVARGTNRDGMFAAFNVAGSLGFLTGPIVGGLLAQWSLGRWGAVNYAAIFMVPGALEVLVALGAWTLLRRLPLDTGSRSRPVGIHRSPATS
jgi:MFS family permease